VRGLSNFHKRRAIFSWCRKQKADLIFLQETHSTTERQDQWRKEWGASILFSHGSTNARGVAILIKNSLNIIIQQSEISSDGRFIFYRNLSKLLRKDEFGNEENIIIGGDFNCPLDITLDKKGEIESSGRGAGFWKLNTSLLANENYKHMITNNLPTWLDAGKDIHDPRLLWDWIKFNIRSNSIIFSKQIASIRRKQEEELNKRYQEAVLMFHTNPCNNTRLALEKSKQDLEALYEDKVEGIILRARARWHEHGEKNNKYFLNLEKRNHV
ncbi:unnamed protein product, partial [Pocillopora meandrina]